MHTSSKARILVVEDEPASAMHIETRLELMDYQVTATVASGEDALAQAERTPPDLVLMDIELAGMLDGIQTAEQLRARWQIPVIYLTANDDEATLERAKVTTPFGYLLKPFSERELHHTIEIALYNHRLERQKEEAEAEQRQLEQQLRQARKLESIGILAGGIAHDFNNILGTMMGYTELLLAEMPPSQQEYAYLEQVYLAGERAADLVERLLTFSRAQEQQSLGPLDLGGLIEETLHMLRGMVPASIEIDSQLQPDCPPVLADGTQMHQVLVNLCVNAAHAMRERGGVLRLRLQAVPLADLPPETPEIAALSETDAETVVRLMVQDTGRGMTAEIQEHIFDPFFTTKDPGEGVGLGLSVVHGIIAGHGGAIVVQSEPGAGTTCAVYLPAAPASAAQEEPPPPERSLPAERGFGRILLVDDEEALRRLYEIGLGRLGYQITACATGREALERFQADPQAFDLLFTDQTMPELSGSELSRAVLALRPGLPIILATGYSDVISEDAALKLGIRAYLKKPVKVRVLLQTIQRLLA